MEEWLDRPVFYLACRHHVAEIMAKDCWYELFYDDLGPENEFFNEFKREFPNLNTTADTPTKILACNCRHMADLKQEALDFYEHILTDKNSNNVLPRDDYRQMAETSLIIIGGHLPPGRKLYWHKPGATHMARL